MMRLYQTSVRILGLFSIILISLLYSTCSGKKHGKTNNSHDKQLQVAVVNYPLYYFTRRIGGETLDVFFPEIDGDPAFWHPDIRAIMRLQEVDLIFLNGADYAHWLPQVTLPESRIVNTSGSFKNRYILSKTVITHSHGPEGMHSHQGLVFTTWLDFNQAVDQAEAIKNTLISKVPAEAPVFENNFSELKKDLQQLDSAMMNVGKSLKNQNVYVSHPVYDYWARRYGIHIISEHWEPDQVPDEMQWKHFQHQLDSAKSTIMIWESDPQDSVKSRLSALGVKTYVFDPCANTPKEGDFLGEMKKNIVNLRRAAGVQ